MAGLDSDPQPQKQLFFNKGTEVEVSSDEDGFKGAWYGATVIDSPSKPSSSKKRRQTLVRYKTLVDDDGVTPLKEYVDPSHIRPLPPDEDASKDVDHVFEENDVVDARYRDGWWTGIVRMVLGGSRYRLFFEYPSEVIDFPAEDLRPHWEWSNGNWIRPAKQHTTGSIFRSGTAVEVNLEEKNVRDAWSPAVVIKEYSDSTYLVKYQCSVENEPGTVKTIVDSAHIRPTPPCFEDRDYELLESVDIRYEYGWRPGVITKVLAGRTYLVFLNQGNEDKELDHSQIRPRFEWTDGKWISKSEKTVIVPDNQVQLRSNHKTSGDKKAAAQRERSSAVEDNIEEKTPCTVGMKNLMEQSSSYIEKLTSSSLPLSNKKIKLVDPNGNVLHSCPSKTSTGDSVQGTLTVGGITIRKHRAVNTDGRMSRYCGKMGGDDQTSANTGSLFTGKRVTTKQQKTIETEFQKVEAVTKKGRNVKSLFKSLHSSWADTAVDDMNKGQNETLEMEVEAEAPLILGLEAKELKNIRRNSPLKLSGEKKLKLVKDDKNSDGSAGEKVLELNKLKGGGSQKRKRGRPRKLEITSTDAPETGKGEHGAEDVDNKMVVTDHTTNEVELPTKTRIEPTVSIDVATEKLMEVSKTDCTTKEGGTAIIELSKDVTDIDDQPLSMWVGGGQSSTNGLSCVKSSSGANEIKEKANLVTGRAATDSKGVGEPDDNQFLPFIKRSPVWKAIESMEIFQLVPQNPHFQPLRECKEEFREGSAIGIMVTFASLFDKIASLKFDDPRSLFESTLENLLDLEKHGFDVSLPQGRVNEMLSIIDRHRQLLNESQSAEKLLKECTEEKRKLTEKIDAIEKKINELQGELVTSKLKMEAERIQILKSQLHLETMKREVGNTSSDFEKVAGAPWKLP